MSKKGKELFQRVLTGTTREDLLSEDPENVRYFPELVYRLSLSNESLDNLISSVTKAVKELSDKHCDLTEEGVKTLQEYKELLKQLPLVPKLFKGWKSITSIPFDELTVAGVEFLGKFIRRHNSALTGKILFYAQISEWDKEDTLKLFYCYGNPEKPTVNSCHLYVRDTWFTDFGKNDFHTILLNSFLVKYEQQETELLSPVVRLSTKAVFDITTGTAKIKANRQ